MKLNANLKLIIIFFISFEVSYQKVYAAASAEDLEVINLEDLYKKEEVKPPEKTTITNINNGESTANNEATTTTTTKTTTNSVNSIEENQSSDQINVLKSDSKIGDQKTGEAKSDEIKVKELKDLNQLVPFSEISVIQRKFMPKSERFQLYVGLGLTTNTPWFTNYGAKLNLSYNFTEALGLELSTLFLTSSARDVAKEIKDNHNVEADQFIYTKGYYGLDFIWSPIYGKISYNDNKIVNYEMYFSIGGGQSSTNSMEKNVPTGHLGVGQIFSLSKSMAFRWDYGLNIFQATPVTNGGAVGTSTTGNTEKSMYNDLVLTMGLSFFFPEVTYR